MAVTHIILDTEVSMEGNGSPFSARMFSFAAITVDGGEEFMGELWPTVPWPDNPTLGVIPDGAEPFDRKQVMVDFSDWLAKVTNGGRPVLWSDNPFFDGMFFTVTWDEVMGTPSPFGYSARRIGDLWAGSEMGKHAVGGGKTGAWRNSSGWKRFRRTKHTHNPLDDVRGNREAMLEILKRNGQKVD